MMSFNRSKKSIMYIPSLTDTVTQYVNVDMGLFSPRCQWFSNAIICEHRGSASVSILGNRIFPSAILRTVVAIVVDSAQRVFGWRIAHVFIEVFKRFKPTSANSYSSWRVILIADIVRVVASLLHRLPCFVSASKSAAMFATFTPTAQGGSQSFNRQVFEATTYTSSGKNPPIAFEAVQGDHYKVVELFPKIFGFLLFNAGVPSRILVRHWHYLQCNVDVRGREMFKRLTAPLL